MKTAANPKDIIFPVVKNYQDSNEEKTSTSNKSILRQIFDFLKNVCFARQQFQMFWNQLERKMAIMKYKYFFSFNFFLSPFFCLLFLLFLLLRKTILIAKKDDLNRVAITPKHEIYIFCFKQFWTKTIIKSIKL